MLTRRDFIVAGLATGSTVAGLRLCYPSVAETPGLLSAEPAGLIIESGLGQPVDSLLRSLNNSDKLGAAWLAEQTTPINIHALGEQLGRRLDLTSTELPGLVAAQVKSDFRHGRMCVVDGWELSQTECELAGLRQLAIAAHPENRAQLATIALAAPASAYRQGVIATLENWGPRKTIQGQKFNEQADGHSGLWFVMKGVPRYAKIMISGQLVKTSVSEEVVTSGLFGDMQDQILATPGSYPIALVDPVNKVLQPIGDLVIQPDSQLQQRQADQSKELCAVTNWWPRKTRAGVAANPQPDGAMGMRIHTTCVPKGTVLMLVDDALPITRTSYGFTAAIPLALLGAVGKKPLYVLNTKTLQKQLIGYLAIN